MRTLAPERCAELLDRGLLDWCAPTLAGLKPASMFSVPRFHEVGRCACGKPCMGEYAPGELDEALARATGRLEACGVRVRALATRPGSMLVLMWRPALMEAFVQRDAEAALLELEGYDVSSAEACVTRLQERLRAFDACPRNPDGTDRFPHEVGFLLGYPLDDVLGFVRDRQHPLLRGCWNVHADVPRAQRIFTLYEASATLAAARFDLGEPLEAIASAASYPTEALLALYA